MGFAFEEAARTGTIEVPLDIQLEEIAGMVSWSTSASSDRTGHPLGQAEGLEIEVVNEGVDDTNRIVGRNIVVEDRRKLDDGMTISALDVRHEQAF